MPLVKHAADLESLYGRLNRRRFVDPDPLVFVYEYDNPADREVVGLLAASLAYGRVAQILKSVRVVLDAIGPAVAKAVRDEPPSHWEERLESFRHRFTTGLEIAGLLRGMHYALVRHGSLEKCFMAGVSAGDSTTLPALSAMVRVLETGAGGDLGHLLPDPADGSACKRLNLYLRWMVRKDDVDVGCWRGVHPRMLVVPLDTHMRNIGAVLGALRRKAGDARAAQELTAAFAGICPDDPVKYDFCLTRLGIRNESDLQELRARFGIRPR